MSLVTAIFLLVVMAGLAAVIARLGAFLHQGAALDAGGNFAYRAARAGIEWGAYQALIGGSCAAQNDIDLAPMGLTGYSVRVACAASTITEGTTSKTVYRLTATGCNDSACPNAAPGVNYVERQLTATIGRP